MTLQQKGAGIFLGALLLLSGSLVFGGGGSPAVLAEGLAVTIAIAVAAWLAMRGDLTWAALPRGVRWLTVALVLLVVLQLVPLPPTLWHGLPGREAIVAGFAAAGMADRWWPLSIEPLSTAWSLIALVPPVLALAVMSSLAPVRRPAVLLALIACALVSALLQGVQLLSGEFYPHPRSIDAGPGGLFANQNSQADFLVIALLAVAALAAMPAAARPAIGRPALLGVALFLALSVLLTGSRSGILLLTIPAGAAVWLGWSAGQLRLSARRVAYALGGAIAVAALLAIAAQQSAVVADVLARFDVTSDPRFERIWPDAWYTAQLFLPLGSGVGTFTPAFEQSEQLAILAPGYANRAHFEYLEWLVEAGVPGVLLLLAGFAMVAWHAIAKSRGGADPILVFALGTILVVVLHSVVDYPLRNIGLAVTFATSLAFLFGKRSV